MRACDNAMHRLSWRVMERRCHHSAFDGYRRTPSEYSLVTCLIDARAWRTKAAYVDDLPDLERKDES